MINSEINEVLGFSTVFLNCGFSNDKTMGLSVRGVFMFELDGDWRGVLVTVSVVKDAGGKDWVEDLGTDLLFIADA